MSASKYITKEDVVFWVQNQDPDFSSNDIPDVVLKLCDVRIHTWLIDNAVANITAEGLSDPLSLLWAACLCMCLEMLCVRGQITWQTGDLALYKLNQVVHSFQRWQPMFFFATGGAKGFLGLLPHETFRMMAYAFCTAYSDKKFFDDHGSVVPIPRSIIDMTSRGYNWNEDLSLVDLADKGIFYRDDELDELLDDV